ncbi:MAG: hypothetical protein PVG37_08630, partial [Desulfobacterales bacterium]
YRNTLPIVGAEWRSRSSGVGVKRKSRQTGSQQNGDPAYRGCMDERQGEPNDLSRRSLDEFGSSSDGNNVTKMC